MNSPSRPPFQRLVDYLLPASCSVCHREGHWWCSEALPWPQCFFCQRSHHPEHSRIGCPKRSLPLIYLGRFKDDPNLRSRLHEWKYEGYWTLSTDWGRALARSLLRSNLVSLPLVPIPIHPRRQLSRGFHQTSRLAQDIAAETGQPIVEDLLVKHRSTPPQALKENREERLTNLGASFSARARIRRESREIILVDDVVTSGATIGTARTICHQAGWRVRAVVAVATDR